MFECELIKNGDMRVKLGFYIKKFTNLMFLANKTLISTSFIYFEMIFTNFENASKRD